MAQNLLSDAATRNAKPQAKEYLLSDGEGLFLRVRPNGSKDWLFVYTFGGKRRKLGLGSYGAASLSTARNEAVKARDKLAQLIDPQLDRTEREAEQEAKRQAMHTQAVRITVGGKGGLFERWASVDLIRRKDGGAEVRRMFEKDVLPILGSMAVEDVKKGHITAVTDALLARGVTRMAKLIFSLMRQMFRFAVDRDIIEADPTAAIRKVRIGGQATERDRVLSEDEIRTLAAKLPQAGLTASAEAAVWIALSTCCRIGELLGAKWEHVDLDKGTWLIPTENAKNGKAHTVFLSDSALGQFQALKDVAEKALEKAREENPGVKACPWIYPNRTSEGPVSSKTVTKQLGDRQRPGLKPMKGRAKASRADALVLVGGKWGPHDLRRTGATMMVALGALPEVAERCLNHVEPNRVKRTYQRHSYEGEMQEAWRLLGERLELLCRAESSNVITLHRGAA